MKNKTHPIRRVGEENIRTGFHPHAGKVIQQPMNVAMWDIITASE
jgi:hypothetical protein